MQPIIAKCGNRRDLCPLYKENFSPTEVEAINGQLYKYHHDSRGPRPCHSRGCEGCLVDGYRPRQECRIRQCAMTRQLPTCADCPDLFCRLLDADMAVAEGSLARYGEGMPPEDFARYFKPFMIRERLTLLRRGRSGEA